MGENPPFVTLSSRRPGDGSSLSSGDSAYGSSAGDERTHSATHDISRTNYHVKHLPDFAKSLEDSAARAFPNNRSSQRYKKVHAILLHWKSDDLFVLPELEDLDNCFREDYSFETEIFPIPSDNAHLELMLRIGAMIKEHESNDTLFVVYYGGHARIDDSRQSTWCATRNSDSPWLQWSAIQTLLERSLSDVLILLDCCAGAASATFPNGNSITETISASSWDAIAPDPGRYSFTNALIEVLLEWKLRTFSAAMLHAEVLARLKHPRPILLNGKHFEARSTPVHFMMTANHKAPSIEMSRIVASDKRPPSPPQEAAPEQYSAAGRSAGPQQEAIVGSEPNEDKPHVMISLALEEDQRLNVNEWETWLAAIPALAKYVKVQGVFKSHSSLLLLSMPVMVWDLLPENPACNFVAFIRSNNLAIRDNEREEAPAADLPVRVENDVGSVRDSIMSGTTAWTVPSVRSTSVRTANRGGHSSSLEPPSRPLPFTPSHTYSLPPSESASRALRTHTPGMSRPKYPTGPLSGLGLSRSVSHDDISRTPIMNRTRGSQITSVGPGVDIERRPRLAPHVEARLERYFADNQRPTVAVTEFLASNLGVETTDINLWFHHRRDQQEVSDRLQSLKLDDHSHEPLKDGAKMMLPGHLKALLEFIAPSRILVVDMRSAIEFERTHIHGAVNFRVPASFVARATLDMVENALPDDESRSIFHKWKSSKCIVFYDRHVEFTWEAPTAETLYQKFRSYGWTGQAFILKGHFREFSESFDKYISGTRMTDLGKEYLESMQEKSFEKRHDNTHQYDQWLNLLEEEDRIHHSDLVPAAKAERMEAMVQHQKDVEDEFEHCQPSLYKKAQDLKPDGNWAIKAPMVEHLERGLTKMQEASMAVSAAGDGREDFPYSKMASLLPPSEEYEMVDSDIETGYHKPGHKPGSGSSKMSSDDVDEKKAVRGMGNSGLGLLNKLKRGGRTDHHHHR